MSKIDPKDVRVGDWVRRNGEQWLCRVTGVIESYVRRDGFNALPMAEIVEVIRPAEPRTPRKIKRSELIAWWLEQESPGITHSTAHDGCAIGVFCGLGGWHYGPTIYAAIIKLRAELRKKGKLT